MHGHPSSLAVAITEGHVRFTFPDGSTDEIRMNAGEVIEIPAGDHLPENLSDQPFETILVEFKT